jgi:hypothetical protein
MKKTLKEESDIFNVSLNTIYRWEHDLNVPRKSVLSKIASYYDVPFSWLLQGNVVGEDKATSTSKATCNCNCKGYSKCSGQVSPPCHAEFKVSPPSHAEPRLSKLGMNTMQANTIPSVQQVRRSSAGLGMNTMCSSSIILHPESPTEQKILRILRKLPDTSLYKVLGYIERICVEDIEDELGFAAMLNLLNLRFSRFSGARHEYHDMAKEKPEQET